MLYRDFELAPVRGGGEAGEHLAFTIVPTHLATRLKPRTRTQPAPTISRPGLLAIDVEARRAKLIEPQFLNMCIPGVPACLPSVMYELITTEGNRDDRYLNVSRNIPKLGARCLAEDKAACSTIQDYALDWARNSWLERPAGGDDDNDTCWEDALTVNMRLLGPMSVALSIAEQDAPMAAADRAIFDRWLKKMVDAFDHRMSKKRRYKGGRRDGTSARKAANNHAVQSSLAAMSYGAWANDPACFERGITQWFITLGSMRRDGSLSVETRRGARALYYHGRTLSVLMQIGEWATVQGIDLYGTAPKRRRTIHQAAASMIDAMEDPKRDVKYAKTNRHPGPSKDYYTVQDLGSVGSTLGWVGIYMGRFPDHPNTERLAHRRELAHSDADNYLTEKLEVVFRANGMSGEWTGVDGACFHAAPGGGGSTARGVAPQREPCPDGWSSYGRKLGQNSCHFLLGVVPVPALPSWGDVHAAAAACVAERGMATAPPFGALKAARGSMKSFTIAVVASSDARSNRAALHAGRRAVLGERLFGAKGRERAAQLVLDEHPAHPLVAGAVELAEDPARDGVFGEVRAAGLDGRDHFGRCEGAADEREVGPAERLDRHPGPHVHDVAELDVDCGGGLEAGQRHGRVPGHERAVERARGLGNQRGQGAGPGGGPACLWSRVRSRAGTA